MGWSYRKSLSFGPLRLNLSKSGVGYSVGVPGFRTGIRSDGRRYVRAGIPGTGLGYRAEGRAVQQAGCLMTIAALGAGAGSLAWALTRFA